MPEVVGTSIAIAVVVISIFISGIALGIGRAFGYKKLERFGMEELAQAVINAALVGAILGILGLLSGITASFATPLCGDGNPLNEAECSLQSFTTNVFSLYQEILRASELLSYYQGLDLNLGSFSVQPLAYLKNSLDALSQQAMQLQFLLLVSYLQLTFLAFVKQNAFFLLLSAGLIFRAFFATRKFGAFLIALFIGVYFFYPLFLLLFDFPEIQVTAATDELKNFTSHRLYSAAPLLDLNGSFALAEKIDAMSMRGNISMLVNNTPANVTADLTGDLTLLTQTGTRALGHLWMALAVAPFISLLVVGVLVKELTSSLSAEIGFTLEAV